MPVRTDRGRAAALRHFWSWPLRSGRHLVVTVLAVATAITVVALVASLTRHPDTDPTPEAAAMAAAPTSTAPQHPVGTRPHAPVGPTTRLSTPSASAPPPSLPTTPSRSPAGKVSDGTAGATATAVGFVEHWLRPPDGTPARQWRHGLYPYVAPDSRGQLRSINPANVPATQITGKPTVLSSGTAVTVVSVPTDAGPIRVTVVAHPSGRWLVRSWAKGGA